LIAGWPRNLLLLKRVSKSAPKAFYRTSALVSIRATAPYLHNNSVGSHTGDPSVAGRMAACEDGITKLLWPRKRLGDHGQCGACTVLVDGRRINSCLTLAVMQAGKQITTVEGLAAGDTLHLVQAAFIKHDAFQCGYCTPGQLCSAAGLLREGHAHNDDDIREVMSGNLCRCGAYNNILAAI
jgi:aerobic-type carbon monoxide dehydrogenase small subunit (CoxS/CutS family)